MATFETIKAAITGVLTKHFPDDPGALRDVALYSQEEWAKRKELLGNNALLSFTFEGPIYNVINGYCADRKLTRDFNTDLGTALAALEVYQEMGYAWSMHVYPITKG